MLLFYLLPLLPYLLFRFKRSSAAVKLIFITILQIAIFYITLLLGYSLKDEIILGGASMIGDILQLLFIINVVTIIASTIIKRVNKHSIKDGI